MCVYRGTRKLARARLPVIHIRKISNQVLVCGHRLQMIILTGPAKVEELQIQVQVQRKRQEVIIIYIPIPALIIPGRMLVLFPLVLTLLVKEAVFLLLAIIWMVVQWDGLNYLQAPIMVLPGIKSGVPGVQGMEQIGFNKMSMSRNMPGKKFGLNFLVLWIHNLQAISQLMRYLLPL